jgi:hypothetical protein
LRTTDGILDGTDDFSAIKMPSGRAAMIERMQALLGETKAASIRVLSAEEALVEDIRTRHDERLIRAELRADRLLMVLDLDPGALAAEQARLRQENSFGQPAVELIDRTAWQMLQRLTQAGILQFTPTPTRVLHCAEEGAGVDTVPAARAA